MIRLTVAALLSFTVLAACSIKEEKIVQQPAPAATVVATPAPATSTTVYTPAPAASTTVYTR